MSSVGFPRRPGQGDLGRRIQVRANLFPILQLPNQTMFQYKVSIPNAQDIGCRRQVLDTWKRSMVEPLVGEVLSHSFEDKSFILTYSRLPEQALKLHFKVDLSQRRFGYSVPFKMVLLPRAYL
jgi:hypothetical protein